MQCEPDDPRRFSPSAARNRDPILAVLSGHLPERGTVLEVASGSGEHIVHLAAAMGEGLTFQPTDADAAARASIDAWAQEMRRRNVLPALALDATAWPWPVAAADAVMCINMIHIAPWEATTGLMRGAAGVLPPGGLLYLYGPFTVGGIHTAESNADFDASLRARDPAWGVRDLAAVTAEANAAGFAAPEAVPMPANNLSLFFRRL
jgi:SAM-dependent methyltransferase